jgi:hypothetical protein
MEGRFEGSELQRAIIASVGRDLDRFERRDEVPRRRARRPSSGSIVYSIRLDPEEVQVLETQAAELNMRPTVLARNLIRTGLAARYDDVLSDAIDRLEQALAEVRALIP